MDDRLWEQWTEAAKGSKGRKTADKFGCWGGYQIRAFYFLAQDCQISKVWTYGTDKYYEI